MRFVLALRNSIFSSSVLMVIAVNLAAIAVRHRATQVEWWVYIIPASICFVVVGMRIDNAAKALRGDW